MYDYYGVAKKICDGLKAEKLNGWSDKLTNVIESGSTGTEIFMGLRSSLNNFLVENVSCSDGLKKMIKELSSELDKALK